MLLIKGKFNIQSGEVLIELSKKTIKQNKGIGERLPLDLSIKFAESFYNYVLAYMFEHNYKSSEEISDFEKLILQEKHKKIFNKINNTNIME